MIFTVAKSFMLNIDRSEKSSPKTKGSIIRFRFKLGRSATSPCQEELTTPEGQLLRFYQTKTTILLKHQRQVKFDLKKEEFERFKNIPWSSDILNMKMDSNVGKGSGTTHKRGDRREWLLQQHEYNIKEK